MDEAAWLTSNDPAAMLHHIRDRISDRQARLFSVACADLFGLSAGHYGGDGERIADPAGKAGEWCRQSPGGPSGRFTRPAVAALLREIVGNPFRPVTLPWGLCVHCGEPMAQRVVGAHVAGPCPWLTADVLAVAQAAYAERLGSKCAACGGKGNVRKAEIYASRWDREECDACRGAGRIDDGALDPVRLAVLADALEEAGASGEILAHLRSPAVHVRGCFAVDLVLGKS